jgi:hypothetical protein
MVCAGELCESARVQSLPLFEATIEAGSPLKAKYAQPAKVVVSRGWPLAVLAVGIWAVATGAILAGLLMAAVGGVWLSVLQQSVQTADRKRADWLRSMICLECKHVWLP